MPQVPECESSLFCSRQTSLKGRASHPQPVPQEPPQLPSTPKPSLAQKAAATPSPPDTRSPERLRSLLLELFNGVINLLLTFGIILIKTVLGMYY